MDKLITTENLKLFAYTNDHLIKNKIMGIVLNFHGLSDCIMIHEDSLESKLHAEKDALYIFPYYGPWSWMNDKAVKTVDEIVDVAIEKYNLNADIPIISTGGSMGGLSALVYTKYSKHKIIACAANCPVCDLPYHYTEREDIPRTLYNAFLHYDCDLEQALKLASPIHLAESMPQIPYYIVHGDADMAVNKKKHSDKFVAAMLKEGHNIKYDEVRGLGHCDLQGEHFKAYYDFIFSFLIN